MKDSLNKPETKTSSAEGTASGMTVKEQDLLLVDRFLAGDEGAFQELVERYQSKVYGIAFGYCRNRDDALDRTQEAFVKVYRNLKNFQKSSSFYTWLYRVTSNVCLDYLRKAKRHRRHLDNDDTREHGGGSGDEHEVAYSRSGASPAKILGNKELGEKLTQAIDELSESHREIIVLREIEGLSYEELSEILGVPKGTVMSRLHHARTNLKKVLKGYLEG